MTGETKTSRLPHPMLVTKKKMIRAGSFIRHPKSQAKAKMKEVLSDTSDTRGSVLSRTSVTRYSSSTEEEDDIISTIRSNVIGSRTVVSTPFGSREMVYADYTASGRCLKFVEEYMMNVVSPMYANTHTEASTTGAQTTRLREEARDIIRQALNAPKDEYAVMFAGNGSTGAIDKLFRVLGFGIPEYADNKWNLSSTLIPEEERPIVFISHLEHHSNELIWRESIARCVVIDEDDRGLPDLDHLERELIRYKDQNVPMLGSFSAGSNVTGIRTPVRTITKLLHQHGAYACFDYAGVGAYVDIDIRGKGGDDSMDAVFLSPHKFIGGPGSSGVLVACRQIFQGAFGVEIATPTIPGGGTVSFVAKCAQVYSQDLETREDAGTPGIPQCIRAGLVFKLKEMVGHEKIERLEADHGELALSAWQHHPSISLVGSDRLAYFDVQNRVSIISFNVVSPVVGAEIKETLDDLRSAYSSAINNLVGRNGVEQPPKGPKLPLHFNFVIALLNDLYGIQGRGGCSCAGPYAASLFGSDGGEKSMWLSDRTQLLAENGLEAFKLGWARVNFNYFISEAETDFIVEAVKQVAEHGWKLLPLYTQDLSTGQFVHQKGFDSGFSLHDFSIGNNIGIEVEGPISFSGERSSASFQDVLNKAMEEYTAAENLKRSSAISVRDFVSSDVPDCVDPMRDIWWLRPSEAAAAISKAKNPLSGGKAAF